jgi:hypothetical protein
MHGFYYKKLSIRDESTTKRKIKYENERSKIKNNN